MALDIIVQTRSRKHNTSMSIIDGHNIYFGDSRYQSYETHNDDKRTNNYIKRHIQNENWNNPLTQGFWSRGLLWNEKTIIESITDINERFPNIHAMLNFRNA